MVVVGVNESLYILADDECVEGREEGVLNWLIGRRSRDRSQDVQNDRSDNCRKDTQNEGCKVGAGAGN